MTNVLLLARLAGMQVDLGEAESWFYGNQNLPSLVEHVADIEPVLGVLGQVPYDDDLRELLPYVLEPYGPGSRLSVIRTPATRVARDAKRETGVFYTPADVAEYIVQETLARKTRRCLDPSCGTGVFLVAALRTRKSDRLSFATRFLYGLDVSSLAIECCAFVLLHHCLPVTNPWSAWHAIRLNLVATDALRIRRIVASTPSYSKATATRERMRGQLVAGGFVPVKVERLPIDAKPPDSLFAEEGLPPLGALLPEAELGFEVLVGNPPYAAVGDRSDRSALASEFVSLQSGNGTADVYPAFIEMMWRLTRPGSAAAGLVVPLSIAYQQRKQFVACRRAMANAGGRWRFAFFDREPHALFGEDVKTRNAIVLWTEGPGLSARGQPAELETGPLRKWTSRMRETLFASVDFTCLHGISVDEGIPKLCGGQQSHAFGVLSGRHDRMRTLIGRSRTCRPQEASFESKQPRVFVASTAYNFLNVFRSITVDEKRHPLSENTVHCLEFAEEGDAEMAFAILSSRLTFWLWHVEGDGFHVGAWFIENLPFGRNSFSPAEASALQTSGRCLWAALQAHRIISLNKGKQTVAYRPLKLEKERDAIDGILIQAAGLPDRYKQTLKAFVRDSVIVDGTDVRRSHLLSLFEAREGE